MSRYGCFQEMCENMSELLPFMMTTLDDEKPLIRSISCWAISRYSRWVVDCRFGTAFRRRFFAGVSTACRL